MKSTLKRKAYGSIPHLPKSRLGSGDHKISEGQANIATKKCRKGDTVIVQEKLDGSNVAVANIKGRIVALSRSGYLAETSRYIQHHIFSDWVHQNSARFFELFSHIDADVCWVSGEWIAQAHGTKYELKHEPFVMFDLFLPSSDGNFERCKYHQLMELCDDFVLPSTMVSESSISVDDAAKFFGAKGHHGAIEDIEGYVWRVETDKNVDFLCKFVRQDKQDGKYFDQPVWNAGLMDYLPPKSIKRLNRLD